MVYHDFNCTAHFCYSKKQKLSEMATRTAGAAADMYNTIVFNSVLGANWTNSTAAQALCNYDYRHGYQYVYYIRVVFGDCVYTPEEQASFYVGMVALLFFVVSQLPYVFLLV